MGELPNKLRGLYAAVQLLEWNGCGEYTAGHDRGIDRALDVLEAAGFSDGQSTAADKIDADAAFMEEVRGGLDRITDLEQARRSGGPVPEDLDGLDDALADAVTIAADLLAKMEGK